MSIENAILIERLQEKIRETLDPIIPLGTRCALFDFPNHPNVGDSAIYAGEEIYLKLRHVKEIYICDVSTYLLKILKKRLHKDDIILFSGGGNFGDLWFHNQRLRERVINDFPSQTFIQFSQSVYYENIEHAKSFKTLLKKGINFKMLVRDPESKKRFENIFNYETQVCPDMAFMLGNLNKIGQPKFDIMGLLRTDKESAVHRESFSFPVYDWLEDDNNLLMFIRHLLLRGCSCRPFRRISCAIRYYCEPALYPSYAKTRMRRGCRMLSRGRVVITDRLHAHILCVLMDIPHVVIDNSYGKLTSFINLWTREYAKFRLAKNPEEAKTFAEDLLRSYSS